jgi:hypothetical protein
MRLTAAFSKKPSLPSPVGEIQTNYMAVTSSL